MKASEIVAQYKIVMLGNIGCGKTSLLLKFTDQIYHGQAPCTIGLDFKLKTVFVDKMPYKL